jgi:hypothetical protein
MSGMSLTGVSKEKKMKKTFKYAMPGAGEVEFEAFWNEKVYGGNRHVEIKAIHDRYGHGTRMVWNDQRGWVKNGGMRYAQTVANLFGFK